MNFAFAARLRHFLLLERLLDSILVLEAETKIEQNREHLDIERREVLLCECDRCKFADSLRKSLDAVGLRLHQTELALAVNLVGMLFPLVGAAHVS